MASNRSAVKIIKGTVLKRMRASMRATEITKKSDVAKQNVPDSTYPTLVC